MERGTGKIFSNPSGEGVLPETSHSRKPLLLLGRKRWGKGIVFPEPSESCSWQELELGQMQPLPDPWWGKGIAELKTPYLTLPSCLNPTGNQSVSRAECYSPWSQPPGAQHRSNTGEEWIQDGVLLKHIDILWWGWLGPKERVHMWMSFFFFHFNCRKITREILFYFKV